jgi:SOS response regulatory protein OraA/RecX
VGDTVSLQELIDRYRSLLEKSARGDLERYLARRERSVRQCHDYLLRRRGYPSAIADSAIRYAREYGLVDDRRYSGLVVRAAQSSSRPASGRHVARKLRAAGVSREVVEEALDGFDDASAIDALVRKLRRRYHMSRLDRQTIRRRASAYLARRGFATSAIVEAVGRILNEESVEE